MFVPRVRLVDDFFVAFVDAFVEDFFDGFFVDFVDDLFGDFGERADAEPEGDSEVDVLEPVVVPDGELLPLPAGPAGRADAATEVGTTEAEVGAAPDGAPDPADCAGPDGTWLVGA